MLNDSHQETIPIFFLDATHRPPQPPDALGGVRKVFVASIEEIGIELVKILL